MSPTKSKTPAPVVPAPKEEAPKEKPRDRWGASEVSWTLAREDKPVGVLMRDSGAIIKGHLVGVDRYAIFVETEDYVVHMIFKHAIGEMW